MRKFLRHRSPSAHSYGLIIASVLACLGVASTAAADEPAAAATTPDAHATPSQVATGNSSTDSSVPLTEALDELLPDYSSLTHHQLTKIGARWDTLSDVERRGLLQEVKLRMARQRGSDRTLQIRTQRRYGRIVRRSDGQVLRIETKVVQVQPVPRAPAERSFGVGFERRSADPERGMTKVDEQAAEPPAPSVPAQRVNNSTDNSND